jgi:hypothetical protein
MEHVSTGDEDMDTKNQRNDDGNDDQDALAEDVDEEFDVLSSASVITSDEDESITEEITVS